MNRYRFYIFSLFFIFFVSCEEKIILGDEYSQETKNIRSLYLKQIYGSWSYIDSTRFLHTEQHYNFKANRTLEGRILLKARDSVFIKGKKELTDWSTIINDTITGNWDLLYKSSLEKNVLYFNAKGKFGNSLYVDFFYVNDSVLQISSPLLISKIIKMHRNK